MTSKNSSPSALKSQFQLIQEKRLKQIQDKLNKTCCQYDSLMPLLQIVDFIPHISHHQKQLKNIQKKIRNCEEKLKQKDQKNLTNAQRSQYLQKQIKSKQDYLQSMKKQLLQLELTRKERPNQKYQEEQFDSNKDCDFHRQTFQKHLQQVLAQYKTQMDIQFNKCQKVSLQQFKLQNKQQKVIRQQVRFVDQLLQRIDNEIQMTKGQIQLFNQDLMKFHQFNYHRIQYEIITTSQALDSIKQKYINLKQVDNHNHRQISLKDDQQIFNIKQSMEKCKWQIIGSKKLYLRQLSKLYYVGKDNFQTHKMQIRICKQFEQVESLFKELSFKFGQFLALFS